MKANLNLAIYCRVSSDEQKTGGNIHRQIEQAAIEVDRLGLLKSPGSYLVPRLPSADPKEQYFIDEAYNLEEIREETAFYELLQLCRSGKVNALYVDNIDRIFRSRSHSVRGQIMDLLEDNDVAIYTPTGVISSSLVLQFMSAIGAEDKKQMLRKLHIGKKVKVQNNGSPPNGRTFWGYDFDKTTNKWSIVEEEAKVVRWVVAMSAGKTLEDMPASLKILVEEYPDGVSDKNIIEGLNMVGVNLLGSFKRFKFLRAAQKNPTGKLPRNWLSNIYRDDRYCGQHSYSMKPVEQIGKRGSASTKREIISVKIPAIVSSEDWELAKASRQQRSCSKARHAKQEYLLQNLVHCAVCGGRMSARARHHDFYKSSVKSVVKNIAKYYTCQTKSTGRKGPCTHKKYHPSEKIDSYVWEQVLVYLKNDVANKVHAKTKSTDLIADENRKLILDISELSSKAKELESERQRFLTMLGKDLLSESDWISQKQRLDLEQKALNTQKTKIERAIKLNQKKIIDMKIDDGRVDLVGKYADKLSQLSFQDRKTLCEIVVHKVLIKSDRNIEVFLKG